MIAGALLTLAATVRGQERSGAAFPPGVALRRAKIVAEMSRAGFRAVEPGLVAHQIIFGTVAGGTHTLQLCVADAQARQVTRLLRPQAHRGGIVLFQARPMTASGFLPQLWGESSQRFRGRSRHGTARDVRGRECFAKTGRGEYLQLAAYLANNRCSFGVISGAFGVYLFAGKSGAGRARLLLARHFSNYDTNSSGFN